MVDTYAFPPVEHDDAPPAPHLLALAVLGAWVLHDLGVFLAWREPGLARELLPGSILVVTAGVLLTGLLALRTEVLLAAVILTGVAALPQRVLDTEMAGEMRWLARVAFVTGAIVLTSNPLAGRLRVSGWGLALLLGMLSAAGLCAWRTGQVNPISCGLVLAAALLLATDRLSKGRPIARALLGLALLAALFVSHRQATALRRADLPPPEATAPAGTPNLLFVVLDTVRADHLAPYGAALATTPALDAFVEAHTLRYAEARATSSWTLPAHASLFTGLFPDEHGATRPFGDEDAAGLDLQAWPARPLRPDATTLAEILRERGYRTAAVLANASFLRHEFGLDRGFEHYDDRQSAWLPEYLALAHLAGGALRAGFLPYRDARTISDLALDWLATRPAGPFFLFVNYMDAHAPYLPPAAFDAFGEERWPADSRAPEAGLHALLYDRELAYLDRELGRLLTRLERSGLLDETAVVITSDHGEAFGEHGTWLHGWDLHEEVLRVPLYVKPSAGLEANSARVEPRPVTGAHVFGITLEALGLPASEAPEEGVLAQLHVTEYLMERWRARGVSLLGRRQMAFLEGGRKHLVAEDDEHLSYDLADDPSEALPLQLSAREQDALRARAADWRDRHPAPPAGDPPPALEAGDRQRLFGLGYLGDE